ncbi:MAG: hypothetical protein ACKOPN_06900, partial [Prochlorococcaceae cyanobacterium]
NHIGAELQGQGLALDAVFGPLHIKTAVLQVAGQAEILELIGQLCRRPERPLTALWITHRLEELAHCRGAALMESGRVGGWQRGTTLHQRLTPLRDGRGEG